MPRGTVLGRAVAIVASVGALAVAGVAAAELAGSGPLHGSSGGPLSSSDRPAVVRGRVVDDEGRALSGVLVSDAATSRRARTDRAGRFVLRDRAGERTLTAARPGYVSQAQTHALGRDQRLDFTLWALARSAPATANSADRVLFWVNCSDLVKQTDAELARWREIGVGGFVCMVDHLPGLGGGSNSGRLARALASSRVVDRARRRGMRCYLGFLASSARNRATPFADWFDGRTWGQVVLPDVRNLALTARRLGFVGIALDQELYDSPAATWNWNYPGNRRSEKDVRAAARARGAQLMKAALAGFPGAEIVAYYTRLPGSWEAHARQLLYGGADPFSASVQIDFWNGMTRIEGYGAIRWLDAFFYKTTQANGVGWDQALQYNARAVYSMLSRRFSGWSYASSRLYLSPFAWIDRGPSAYAAPRPPAYVAEQLGAFRRWGTGRTFANFVYDGLRGFDYGAYAAALRAAAAPGVVDSQPPSLVVTSPVGAPAHAPGRTASISGTATDDMALRSILWRDSQGHSGFAQLTPDLTATDGGAVRWVISGIPVASGGTRVWLRAEDIKGLATVATTDLVR